MKPPSEYFIIEQDTNPRKGEREAQERLIKKLNRIKKKGNIPDKLPYDDPSVIDKPESVKNQMAKNIAKQDIEKNSGRESGRIGSEGSGKVKDTVKPEQAKGYKSTEKVKLDNSTSGSAVRSNKAQQKPLGRVVGRVTQDRKARGLEIGDIDPKDSKQLEAQRKVRIDTKRNLPSGKPNPKYGKATPQGVENFAQNRGGYGRGRKLSGDEWKKISGDAKKISSDPSSKAYKDIEAKINKNRDYGGKRAKVMNPNQISQVKKEISKSKTVNTKVDIGKTSKAPTEFRRKPTSTVSLNTSTRRGRIANVSSTPPTPTRQPGTRYSVKGPGSSTGSLSKGTLKFSGDSEYNKLKKIIKNTDGRSTNRPKPTPKKFETFRQGNLFGGGNETSSVTQGFRPNNTPDPNIIKQPKNYNPDQGVLDFNKKKPPVKPKPTPVSTGKPPLTNPQSMLRTPRKSTPKFDSAYNKKGDANLRKLLGKGKRPDYLRGGGPAQVGDPWDPKDYNSKGKSRQTRVDDLDKGFRKKWKEAQDKFKRNTQTKAPEPEWGKSTSKTPYKGTTIKNPTIRQYTSPTLTPSTTRTPFRTPVSPSGSRTPVGGTTGTTGPSGTNSKVTRNDTIPKYKPKPWKTFKGALNKAFIPATIGAQSYIDTSSAQKERGATKSRQVKTGLMDAGANVASWVGTGKLLDLHPAMKKRKLLKFALQTIAQPKVSEFVKNTTGISKYKATQTKVEKQKGIKSQQPSVKKLQKKYPSLVLPTSDQKNLLKKSNFNVNYGFNKTGKFDAKDSKNK